MMGGGIGFRIELPKQMDRTRNELTAHGFSDRLRQKISSFWHHSHNIFTANGSGVLAGEFW